MATSMDTIRKRQTPPPLINVELLMVKTLRGLSFRAGEGARARAREERQDHTKASKEAEALFEQAAREYGDVKMPGGGTVGEKARAELFEIRHLVVGKEASEIEGEDQDGKKFKLSDYRGKVVLLDFWGDW